jgi:hypothetical protein
MSVPLSGGTCASSRRPGDPHPRTQNLDMPAVFASATLRSRFTRAVRDRDQRNVTVGPISCRRFHTARPTLFRLAILAWHRFPLGSVTVCSTPPGRVDRFTRVGPKPFPTPARMAASLQSRSRCRRIISLFRTRGQKGPIAAGADVTAEMALVAQPAPTLATLALSPVELAVIAALNLELARDHEEAAEDNSQHIDTRRRSRQIAIGRRGRARMLHQEVQRLSACPFVHDEQLTLRLSPPYVGPERRRRARRVRDRRARQPSPLGRRAD